MIEQRTAAPDFELPAVVDDDRASVSLAESRGRDVVVLAFYPGDFNPACEDGTSGLDELDLLTMQKDVTVLGISGDSVFSHAAFAETYDLQIPLLSDAHGEVAEAYGVAVADHDAGHLVDRAVVVVALQGDVVFTWRSEEPRHLPPVDAVRDAVESVGGDRASESRYRMGHAHYVEGRRAFTSAMNEFEAEEWMLARGDFDRAETEFTEAADHFNAAGRFAEDPDSQTLFERAEEKAETLWQAAEWLGAAANAYSSGRGAEGESRRQDAERPLEEAREIHEPIPPDEFPPDAEPAALERETPEADTILPTDPAEDAASLDVDIDAAAEETDAELGSEAEADDSVRASEPVAGAETDDEGPASPPAEAESGPVADTGSRADNDDDDDDAEDEGGDDIDEAELEEITAELEEQTEQAQADRDDSLEAVDDPNLADADVEALGAEPGVDEAGATEVEPMEQGASGEGAQPEDSSLDLDLTDPTDGDEGEPADGEGAESGEAAEEADGDEEGEEDDSETDGAAWTGDGL